MRVMLYARYSSDLQRDASIEDQLRVCRVRADREGWSVAEVFTDAAISGSTTHRPGYQRLLAALRQGGVDIVLAESLDRFSRDQEHIAGFYKQAMFAGVRIVTLAEGDISELHIGLKGTMGALYLKDLAQKTHRGLEGRIRQGRSIGQPPYGYRILRRLDGNGDPEYGLREIEPVQASIVRRIFQEYTAGRSPKAIARTLNAECIPGPRGGIWFDETIRGRPHRGNGLLRNRLYIGELVWNRYRTLKDPESGTRHIKARDPGETVVHAVPELRIVPQELWDDVQVRIAREQAARITRTGKTPEYEFWSHRRPRYLLTGKVFCGACGAGFANLGRDYLGCSRAQQGSCGNGRRVRRSILQEHVLDVLGQQLMDPDLVASFVTAFSIEWNRLLAEHGATGEAQRRELQVVERKITNLVDAISEGIRSADLKARLVTLEARRTEMQAHSMREADQLPALHANLAQVYREKVARLRDALHGPDSSEALEAARELIERVIVHPPRNDGDPPGIEIVGDFVAMLQASGLGSNAKDGQAQNTRLLCALVSSVKVDTGGQSPPALLSPRHHLRTDGTQP